MVLFFFKSGLKEILFENKDSSRREDGTMSVKEAKRKEGED